MELKTKSMSVAGMKVLDAEEGIVEAFVAGIGNKDSVGDIILPGAFKDSLATRKPKGVWSHDWDQPVSKTLDVYEVEAGSKELPTKMKSAGIGGLYVKTQFNLATQRGKDAFADVVFYGDEAEWSIGYREVDTEYDEKQKALLLKKIDLYEYSPVLFGANPLTATVGVKSEGGTVTLDGPVSDRVLAKVEALLAEEAQSAAAPESVVIPDDADDVDDAKADAEPIAAEDIPEGSVKCPTCKGTGAIMNNERKCPDCGGKGYVSEEAAEDLKSDESVMSEESDTGEAADPDDAEKSGEGDQVAATDATDAEEKAVPGSQEAAREALYQAATAWAQSTFGQEAYAYPAVTFDSTVVCGVEYRDGDAWTFTFYQFDYLLSGDAAVLANEREVDLVQTVVEKDGDTILAVKGDVERAPEEKAGRVLSATNFSKIEAARDSLQEVIDSASSSDDEKGKVEEPPAKDDEPIAAADDAEEAVTLDDPKVEDGTVTLDDPEPTAISPEDLALLDELAADLA